MESGIRESQKLSEVFFSRFFEDWTHLNDEHLFEYLGPKIEQAITLEELKKLLAGNEKLKIKFGIDPTGPEVHLGHLLPVMLLRQFQKAGHHIDLIIGDFTAMIGDPSGRNDQRPSLTPSDIKRNLKTYLAQIGRYINVKKLAHHRNSKWLSKRTIADVIRDLSRINLSQVLQRDDFRKRLEAGHGLSVAEILYSYAQAMDSVHLESDVEIGGRDQLLNFAHARDVMEIHGQKPEVALVTPVLEGLSGDGRKMSKSYGNYIAVNASSEEKFGKVMSMPDSLLEQYFVAFCDVKKSELEELRSAIESDPLECKKQLAQFLVSVEVHDLDIGRKEREKFEKRFSERSMDDNSEVESFEAKISDSIFDSLYNTGLFKSKSELHRFFDQGSVRRLLSEDSGPWTEEVIRSDESFSAVMKRVEKDKSGVIFIRAGKKIFVKFRLSG